MEKMLIGLQHSIDQASVHRLSSLITDLRPGDEVTITLDSAEEEEAYPVLQVLDEHGFRVQDRGENEGKLYIQARRMYH